MTLSVFGTIPVLRSSASRCSAPGKRENQIVICVPISTARPEGMWK
jgi:hypothetical protein